MLFRSICLIGIISFSPYHVAARDAVFLKDGEYIAVPYGVYAKSRASMYSQDVFKMLQRSTKKRARQVQVPLSIRFSKDPSNDSRID